MGTDRRAASAVEYIVIAALALAVLGPALYALFLSLRDRFVALNNGL